MTRCNFSILLLATASFLLLACSQAPEPAPASKAAAPVKAEPAPVPASEVAIPAAGKVFVCPMTECDEVKAEAAKCTKCGMDLVERDRADLSWVCPMKECNEIQTAPGKCSKCGMNLALRVKVAEPK